VMEIEFRKDFLIVKLLFKNQADLNDIQFPSIVAASRRGKIEEIQYVLDRGADIKYSPMCIRVKQMKRFWGGYRS